MHACYIIIIKVAVKNQLEKSVYYKYEDYNIMYIEGIACTCL